MDNWQPSTLSWSFSQKTHFDSCRRHYFYHRFWGQDPRARWRIYEMRNLTTLMMLRGLVVHEVIAGALKSMRMGVEVGGDEAKQNVTDVIRGRYMESAKRMWHIDNRPQGRKSSEFTSLLEHYYAFPNMNERAREARQVAWLCVENLMGSEFWREIAESDHSTWVAVEEDNFPKFDLDGIQVYTRIDFAHSNSSPMIIDWKTGAVSERDKDQLTLYSMYARAKWGWKPSETTLAAVYLQPELRVETFKPSAEEITRVSELVKESFNEMREVEPAFGPADIEQFPMTEDLSNCAWCRFRGVCPGAKRTE